MAKSAELVNSAKPMQQPAIHHWLKRKTASEAGSCVLFAAGCLAFGGGTLAVTFVFTYAAVWFVLNACISEGVQLVFNQPLRFPPIVIIGSSLSVITMLFWVNARLRHEHFPAAPHGNSSTRETGFSRALASLAAYPGVSAQSLANVPLTGPRLVSIAWSNARKAWRLRWLNVSECSRALAILLRQGGRVAFPELAAAAALSNPRKTFAQLGDISGVVFLTVEPTGLSLTNELRAELRQALAGTDEYFASLDTPAPGTLQELPGVDATAPLEEIETAYRRRLRERGNAKFPGEHRESSTPTERQTAAINAAYEAFCARQPKHGMEQAQPHDAERVWERYNRNDS